MDVPQGTISEVLDWVGDDSQRAQAALDAEYQGQNRSTLIAQLEAIEGSSMSDEPATVDEEVELAPAPEPPAETVIFAEDAGTVISPIHVAHPDVEVGADLQPEVDEREEVVPDPISGPQVETLQTAAGSNGMILAINGETFAFSDQMTATLKHLVDRAIVGLAL